MVVVVGGTVGMVDEGAVVVVEVEVDAGTTVVVVDGTASLSPHPTTTVATTSSPINILGRTRSPWSAHPILSQSYAAKHKDRLWGNGGVDILDGGGGINICRQDSGPPVYAC